MEINWEFQQENARLRSQNEKLQCQIRKMKEIIISYDIPEDDDSPLSKGPLTKSQTNFIRALDLDYGEIYRLAKKYESGFDAIEEIMEADGYEFNRVI